MNTELAQQSMPPTEQQAALTYAMVAEQYGQQALSDPQNFSPDFHSTVHNLAADEAVAIEQTEAATVQQTEAFAAQAAEADGPRHEITAEHHDRHQALVESVDPDVDESKVDLVGEVIELGQEALKNDAEDADGVVERIFAACDAYDPTTLSTTLDTLKGADGSYDSRAAQVVTAAVTKVMADQKVNARVIQRELANRPELLDGMVTRAHEPAASDWERLSVGLAVTGAVECRRDRTADELRYNGNPFEDPLISSAADSENIARDATAADEMAARAGDLMLDKNAFYDNRHLVVKYGSMAEAGVTTDQARQYAKLSNRGAVRYDPSAADVIKLTSDLADAPEAVQQLIATRSSVDVLKLLAASELTTKLSQEIADLEPDKQQAYISKFAEITGCNSRAPEDLTAKAQTAIAEAMSAGASLAGLIDIIGHSSHIELFDKVKQYDAVKYQESLQMLGRMSQQREIIAGYDGGYHRDNLYNNQVLRGLLGSPQNYAQSLELMEQRSGQVRATGYPAEGVNDESLEIFSIYASNLMNAYHENSMENVLATSLDSKYRAMELIGDSTLGLLQVTGGEDRFMTNLAYDMYRNPDKQPTAEQVRGQLGALSEYMLQVAEQNPDGMAILLRATREADLSYELADVPNWLTLAELARDSGPVYADYLIDLGMQASIAQNLAVFNSIDDNVGRRLIDKLQARAVIDNAEQFVGLELNQELADYVISKGQIFNVLDRMDKFTDLNRLDLAARVIASGNGLQILHRLDEFPGLADSESDNPEIQRFTGMLKDKAFNALINDDGPLQAMANQFRALYLATENPQSITRRMQALTEGETSMWRTSHEYAKLLVGEVGNVGYLSTYQVDAIPLSLPRADIGNLDGALPAPINFLDMDADTRRMVLSEASQAENTDVMSLDAVHFTDLKPDFQDGLLAYRLYESIATSRDLGAQQAASERNRTFADSNNYWHKGDLVHATSRPADFRNMLQSGLMCGETLGMRSGRDSYPFNVDTVTVSDAVLAGEDHVTRLAALKNSHYGSIGLLLHRSAESTDYQRETQGGMNVDHRLIFGGVSSTEISAVLLRGASDQVTGDVIDAIVDAGIYMSVVNDAGQNLLSYEAFQAKREDSNYATVKPRIVDSSFKREGTQGGSNEGAMFIMPTSQGMQHYYVKFGDASPQKRDHLWTEMLADELYREVTPDLVPATEAVTVEGRLARASKIVELAADGTVTNAARNAGFIMDCFVGNWDAVYNSDNLVMSKDGQAMRIDTGNALDFRARGEKKAPEAFGPIVTEVNATTSKEDLGGGMRQMYPGLEDAAIKAQVKELRDRLPDSVIDALVDSIRRPKAERLELAATLKARRKYLIDRFV